MDLNCPASSCSRDSIVRTVNSSNDQLGKVNQLCDDLPIEMDCSLGQFSLKMAYTTGPIPEPPWIPYCV